MGGAHLGTCVVLLVHGGVVHQAMVQGRRQTRNQPVWLARRVILQHDANTALTRHGQGRRDTERRPAHSLAAQTLLVPTRTSRADTTGAHARWPPGEGPIPADLAGRLGPGIRPGRLQLCRRGRDVAMSDGGWHPRVTGLRTNIHRCRRLQLPRSDRHSCKTFRPSEKCSLCMYCAFTV